MDKKQIEILKNKIGVLQSNDSLSLGAQNLVKLLSLSDTDEDVAKRLNELSTTSKAEFINYGKEKGLDFTEEDMNVISNELFGASDELTDADLEDVAGGITAVVAAAVGGLVAGVLLASN